MPSEIIYVRADNLMRDSWQAVLALKCDCGCFEILGASNDPEHEIWEFTKGDVVGCEIHSFYEDESGLVAVKRCNCRDATREGG